MIGQSTQQGHAVCPISSTSSLLLLSWWIFNCLSKHLGQDMCVRTDKAQRPPVAAACFGSAAERAKAERAASCGTESSGATARPQRGPCLQLSADIPQHLLMLKPTSWEERDRDLVTPFISWRDSTQLTIPASPELLAAQVTSSPQSLIWTTAKPSTEAHQYWGICLTHVLRYRDDHLFQNRIKSKHLDKTKTSVLYLQWWRIHVKRDWFFIIYQGKWEQIMHPETSVVSEDMMSFSGKNGLKTDTQKRKDVTSLQQNPSSRTLSVAIFTHVRAPTVGRLFHKSEN